MKHLDDTTILRAEVGSTAHGITHGSNDIDEIAVFVPPPTDVLGVGNLADSISYRPGRKADEPSQPGDLDRVYHSLRKFVSLLVKGNPSILFTLYAPILVTTPLGHDLIRRRHLMVHDSTRARYLGYMTSQRQRITGERGAAGRIRRSPEGGGEIAAPVEEPLRSHLLAVRHGEIPLKAVLREAERLEAKVAALELERPTQTYFDEWSTWLADAHLTYWSTQ
jgi:hypothetical protein